MVVDSTNEGTLQNVDIDWPVVTVSIERMIVTVSVGGTAVNVTVDELERERVGGVGDGGVGAGTEMNRLPISRCCTGDCDRWEVAGKAPASTAGIGGAAIADIGGAVIARIGVAVSASVATDRHPVNGQGEGKADSLRSGQRELRMPSASKL